MSTAQSTNDDARRVLRFNSPQELIDDLQEMRNGPVRALKKWTLPQACWHLSMVIEQNQEPPTTTVRTAEQEAMKAKFFGMVMSPQGMPENLPLPQQFDPPSDCGPEQIDRLISAFEKLDAFPHTHITVGRCGPVSVEELRQLHLAHAAHHLSFQRKAERRKAVVFPTMDALIADLRILERGYVQTGNWTLHQMCWHLNQTTSYLISPGPHNVPPPPPGGAARLEAVLKSGQIPDGIDAPQHLLPPTDCADETVEEFIATLQRVKTFNGPFAPHRLFGPLTADQGKKLILMHAARHLSFLVPTTTVIPVQ